MLTDLTDDDGALTEMEDLKSLDDWLAEVYAKMPFEELLDLLLEDFPI